MASYDLLRKHARAYHYVRIFRTINFVSMLTRGVRLQFLFRTSNCVKSHGLHYIIIRLLRSFKSSYFCLRHSSEQQMETGNIYQQYYLLLHFGSTHNSQKKNTSTLRVHLVLNGMGSDSFRKESAPILIYNEGSTFFNAWMFVGCAS